MNQPKRLTEAELLEGWKATVRENALNRTHRHRKSVGAQPVFDLFDAGYTDAHICEALDLRLGTVTDRRRQWSMEKEAAALADRLDELKFTVHRLYYVERRKYRNIAVELGLSEKMTLALIHGRSLKRRR